MRVLFVDGNNTCRSASAATMMRAIAWSWGMGGIETASAGVTAVSGGPGCAEASILRGVPHAARPLTASLLEGADLILACDRRYVRQSARLAPHLRSRIFSLPQAGRYAQWMLSEGVVDAARARAADPLGWKAGASGVLRSVTPLPAVGADPDAWALVELDACRGVGPEGVAGKPRKRWKLVTLSMSRGHTDDVPNPHESHGVTHADVANIQWWNLEALLRLLVAARAGSRVGIA